jgi:peptidoglycan-associated lipoprotein
MPRGGLVGIICLVLGVGDLLLINAVLVPLARSEPVALDDLRPREPARVAQTRRPDAAALARTAASAARPDAASSPPQLARRPDAAAPIPLPEGVPELPDGAPLIVLRFDTNKVDLSAEATAKVAALAKRLRIEPALQVMVAGHSDRRGATELNRRISLSRARRVTAMLAASKIPYGRITTHGYGASRSMGPTNLPGTWVRNRRVEIYVFRKEPR